MAALASSLGNTLSRLELNHCTLTAGFWVALDEMLPALEYLHLRYDVSCSPAHIALFCGRRGPQPFTLELPPGLFKKCDGQELMAGLVAQGLSHVQVLEG
jgi:hypothetical protein